MPSNYIYLSDKLQKDLNFNKLLVSKNEFIINYICNIYKDNYKFMMYCLFYLKETNSLRYLSERLKNNEQFFQPLFDNGYYKCFLYASDILKKDENFINCFILY
jgi:hypothetical protein